MKSKSRRILIADDLTSIHDDFRKILEPRHSAPPIPGLEAFAPSLAKAFGEVLPSYELSFAHQGEEAIRMVQEAKKDGLPFALVFLDVRMPPGIDGVETAEQLLKIAPDLQVVLCTAYSDYSFGEISQRFKDCDNFLILKKPFDPAEILQVAHTLCQKWRLAMENAALLGDLEERVRARTEELEHAKAALQAALVKAQAGERSKASFLSCVSHELYTPLNGILMSSELLQMSDDQETANYGNLILSSCERLQRLFTRILTYVELDKEAPAACHEVSLGKIFKDLDEKYAPQASAKGLAFTIYCPEEDHFVLLGSEVRVGNLIELLVENAVKFTERGGVTVRVHASGDVLTIDVEDTGPGLPAGLDQRLGEMLQPGDLSFNRKHEGLGLGLNLGKRLAECCGGTLAYQKAAEGGSVFSVQLPTQKLAAVLTGKA